MNEIQNQMKARVFLTILVLFLSCCIVNSQKLLKSELDNFINTIIKQNELPGLSIAIVYQDSVIYARGFGVKKLGESDPVDEHTLYEAMSLTKSFTATLIGMLVDQGKIKWTDLVTKYIPAFETNDPFATQILTIQDLLTLRSGLLNGDNLIGSNRMELIPQIRNLKISNSFRLSQTSFNLNYTLAGLIAEMIEGKSWEDMVKNLILYPLKMNETFTDSPSALSSKNISTPHRIENGKMIPLQIGNYGIYSPAEGIYSNVIDLSKWIKLQLDNGTVGSTLIINSETLASLQKPQNIAIDLFKDFFNPEANFMTVGMGWFISDYKGLKVIQMGGLSSGTSNLITIVPSKKIGIIIQSNKGGAFDSFVKINYKVFNDLIFR